jgi:hypothetical protein
VNITPNRNAPMLTASRATSKLFAYCKETTRVDRFHQEHWKESNHLEDVDAGLMHSEQSVYTEYGDPSRDEWAVRVLPALKKILKKIPVSDVLKESRMSRSALFEILAGRSQPHPKNQKRLAEIVRKLGMI